jgi:hypothetical protein
VRRGATRSALEREGQELLAAAEAALAMCDPAAGLARVEFARQVLTLLAFYEYKKQQALSFTSSRARGFKRRTREGTSWST